MGTVQVTDLTKLYQEEKSGPPLRAVDGIDFDVRGGEALGFLGPNGAGKTTTIRMLTVLSRPTAGRAAVMGWDLATDVTHTPALRAVQVSNSVSALFPKRRICTTSCPRSTI